MAVNLETVTDICSDEKCYPETEKKYGYGDAVQAKDLEAQL